MFEYSGLGYAMLREALLAGAVVFLAVSSQCDDSRSI